MRKKVLDKMFDNPPPKRGVPAPKDLPRMPPARIPCSHEELEQHLQKYLKLIKDKGADDARIISRTSSADQGVDLAARLS